MTISIWCWIVARRCVTTTRAALGHCLWVQDDPLQAVLLRDLGPEPLEDGFDGDYLFTQSRTRKVNVKAFIMNAHIVVGVGNIYANEALFLAGIDPRSAAGSVSRERYLQLAQAIRQILAYAIECGGTTLRDFVREDGTPGYFQLELKVYDRVGQACTVCQNADLPDHPRAAFHLVLPGLPNMRLCSWLLSVAEASPCGLPLSQ